MIKFIMSIMVLLMFTGCERPFEEQHWLADFTPPPESSKAACTNPPCSWELACPISPDNCASVSTSVPLSWTTALVGTGIYRVQISLNASFTLIQQDLFIFGTENTVVSVSPGTYYWRVITCDEQGYPLAWSPGRSFFAHLGEI